MNSIRNLARLLGIDNVVLVKAAVWYFFSLERERQYEVLEKFFGSRRGNPVEFRIKKRNQEKYIREKRDDVDDDL